MTTSSDDKDSLCYHRHQYVGPDWGGVTVAGYPVGVKRECLDCRASVQSPYNFPVPEMPPMPFESSDREEAKP